MSTFDITNAIFEAGGSATIWLNIARIRKDKGYAGLSLASVIFFTVWGLWNLLYYPSLGQWFSFGAGCAITLANAVWIAHLVFYGRKQNNEKHNSNEIRKKV